MSTNFPFYFKETKLFAQNKIMLSLYNKTKEATNQTKIAKSKECKN